MNKAFRLSAIFLLLLVIVLANAWFLYSTFHKVGDHQAWVAHTNSVISELNLLRASVVDVESGQRGFLLTGEESFLEPYYRGLGEVEKHIFSVQQLTTDNSAQQAEFAKLAAIVKRRISHINKILDARTLSAIKPAERIQLLGEGRALMRQLYDQVEIMKALETRLLDERTEEFKRARFNFLLLLFGTTALTICALSVSTHLLRKNQIRMELERERGRRQAEIQENLAIGAAAVAGNLLPNELAARAQEFLANRLHILSSRFYMFSGGRLNLVASQGVGGKSNFAADAPSSNLVEEAVKRSEFWWVQDVPPNYWKISSGLGEALPNHLVFLPLVFQGRKLGVVELALFSEPHEDSREILSKYAELIAIALNAAVARVELQSLLERTQQQAEELEAQQEELRASNEELEQQTRALETQQQSLNIKNRELQEVQVALQDKANDLQLSSQYKSDFLAKMSHELRTPLNGLLILSTLLMENKQNNLTEQQKQFAASINSAGNDLLLLINDILDLSKIEARKLSLKAEAFMLTALLDNLEATFGPQVSAKNISFNVKIPTEAKGAKLNTDRQRVEQVLRNFLSNAIKFTEKGEISIDACLLHNDTIVEIGVSDSGIGIPEAKRELIFQAFEQGDSSVSRKFGGTGLGLTISRELAALLGGEIYVESREGEGSRFALRIPLNLPAGQASNSPSSHPEKMVEPVPRNHSFTKEQPMADEILRRVPQEGRSILIVEDDEAFLSSVSVAAKGYGYNVIPVRDGELAMAILEKHTPDAILLDIKLPGISGLGILEMVKQMPRLRHVPVHMISGLDYQLNALRLGALGYLTKPVTVEKIRSALDRIENLVSSQVRHILLIEDDERQSKGIASLVAGEDVEIERVHSGEEALASLSTNVYDCVIMDLTLPQMSGFEILDKLSSLNISVPPIVIYTAKDLTAREEEYLRKFSESIIIKGARSPERLLDEVNLFLHRVESLMPEDKREMLSQLRSEQKSFEGKTVLIVDDDMRNVFAMTSALESKGLDVRIAKDGVEALEALDAHPDIDLVLMDIMMPRMDGFEAMRRIRKHSSEKVRELPIIALTAKAMREDHEKCIEAGASDYIPKPVDLRHLMTILKVWLANKGIFA